MVSAIKRVDYTYKINYYIYKLSITIKRKVLAGSSCTFNILIKLFLVMTNLTAIPRWDEGLQIPFYSTNS